MRPESDDHEGWGGEPAESEFDLRVVLDFLRRRKWAILLVTVPLLIPATIYPFQLKPYYEATATVAIRSTPKVLEFGADFMPGSSPDRRMYGGAPNEAALVTLVNSDAVLGRVIDQLPASGGETQKSVMQRAREAISSVRQEPLTPEQNRAARIDFLRAIITTAVTDGGSYLRITSGGESPGSATFIVNAVADAYVKHQEDQREQASRRAIDWLNRQVYELRDQAARKEQGLAEIASTNNLSPAVLEEDSSEGTQNSALEQVETDLQTARVNLLSAQERLAALSPRASRPSEGDRAGANLREQYAAATAELESARLRFTPTHPEVRRLEGVIQGLSQRLRADPAGSRPMLSANEETEYQALLAQEAQERARVRVLEKTRSDVMASTGSKSDAVSRYRRLARELAIDKQILEVLMTRRNETLLAAATKEIGAEVLDYAVAPSVPSGPKRRKYLVAGYAVAFALGFGLALLLELLDRRLRNPEAIAALLGTTSLGMVPMIETRKTPPERQAVDAPGSAAGESYRNVRTSLIFAMRIAKLHCLLVTSSVAGEGKTTTCVNLAGAFGRVGRRVILIDADLRRPRVHRVFRIPASPGLSEVLQGQARIEDAVVRPERANFDLLPAGAIPDNPSELLGSAIFSQVITDLKGEYDLVVLDSAVLLAVPDALLLAAEADGTLLVHKPGSVDRRGLRRVRDDLHRAGARVLGVVFNKVDPSSSLHYPTYMYSPYIKEDKS